ncbi:hypothetical protein BG003_008517 [Podila horticola]|nr:hypothetical protein BG003_008517 [Podila horticola]
MPPRIEEWVSGIEHISVGDSLVACSTEFSGSVLTFSLATGSLVYEIPGLYQPSKVAVVHGTEEDELKPRRSHKAMGITVMAKAPIAFAALKTVRTWKWTSI